MDHDPLTGLPTRTTFLGAAADMRTGALLYVEVDQLRLSNAVLGPARTDAILKWMARLVEIACDGHLVGRNSGAQFAAFVPDPVAPRGWPKRFGTRSVETTRRSGPTSAWVLPMPA